MDTKGESYMDSGYVYAPYVDYSSIPHSALTNKEEEMPDFQPITEEQQTQMAAGVKAIQDRYPWLKKKRREKDRQIKYMWLVAQFPAGGIGPVEVSEYKISGSVVADKPLQIEITAKNVNALAMMEETALMSDKLEFGTGSIINEYDDGTLSDSVFNKFLFCGCACGENDNEVILLCRADP